MAVEGKPAAEKFLEEILSASDLLEDLAGQKLQFEQIRAAAEKRGFTFTEDEFRAAIAKRVVEEPKIPIYRFCFSEAP